jgi:type I restriction enzyme S subunit
VPPLAEQHRIVAKVDRLMALCDQLESRLATAQTEASRILESVLHNALHSPAESALAVPKHSPDMQPLPQA